MAAHMAAPWVKGSPLSALQSIFAEVSPDPEPALRAMTPEQ
jgi:hypothetical protein